MRMATVLLASCVALAACSSDGEQTPATSSTVSTSRPPVTESPTTTAAPTTTTAPDLEAVEARLVEVAGGLESPVAFAVRSGDDRFYVAEQSGQVRAIDAGSVVDEAVLDIADEVSRGNEQGLLGIAFAPDGQHLYIDFTDTNGDTRVQEFAMSDGVADESSRRELLFVDQPFSNHNGGHVVFGPDGMLYVGLGDGGAGGDPLGSGQDLASLLGKILRIDPRPNGDSPYSVPDDNPFVSRSDVRPEVWMWGLRNPWRFSFDRETRDLWIGDVGQNAYEEVDFAPAGESGINWGWNAREALHEFAGAMPSGARDPVVELTHEDGNCSVTGGFVYRGAAVDSLGGAYVYADFCGGELRAVALEGGRVVDERPLGVQVDQPTSFGEGLDGEIYVLSRGGTVYRIAPA